MAAWTILLLAVNVFLSAISAAPSEVESTVPQDVDKDSKLPEECNGKELCDIKPKGYDELESKINNTLTTEMTPQDSKDNVNRLEDGAVLSPQSDWHNCPYVTKRERMFIHSTGNETNVIVQNQFFQQYVTTVRCAHEYIPEHQRGKAECFQDLGLQAMGIRSTCETIYGKQSFQVYDFNKGQIKTVTYHIPVCCSCKLSHAF